MGNPPRQPPPSPLPLSLPAGTRTHNGFIALTVPVLRGGAYWALWRHWSKPYERPTAAMFASQFEIRWGRPR